MIQKKIYVYLRLPEKNKEVTAFLEGGNIIKVGNIIKKENLSKMGEPLIKYYPPLSENLMGRLPVMTR
jgi:hypothetical protein